MSIEKAFIKLSRNLRKSQTPWEKKIWARLKNRNLFGIKFKRQVVLGSYIYDFASFEKKLIIELDGSGHQDEAIIERDTEKTNYAVREGYEVLRFWNNEIADNLEGVLEKIFLATKKKSTSSVPSGHLLLRGEEGIS